jgi:hypothetical protein
MNNKILELAKYSDFDVAQEKAYKYLGDDAVLFYSPKKDKKYRIYDPNNDKWVDFGSFNPPMMDYTKHKDEKRRENYLRRATNIKGNWRNNPYSPNNLSLHLLWDFNG